MYETEHTLILKLRTWGLTAGYAVADQGLQSGANFLLNILLARWLQPDEYGLFGIAYAVLLALLGIHNALIVEPMAVIGSRYYQDQLKLYVATTLKLNWIFSICVFIAVNFGLFFYLVDNESSATIIVFAISVPCVFLLWFMRRVCYLFADAKLALKGSVAYSIALCCGLWAVYYIDLLSLNIIFALIAVASLLGATVYAKILKINIVPLQKDSSLSQIGVAKIHWQYGGWIFAASVAHSLSTSIYLPAVGMIVGLTESAVLKALQNLIMPLRQVLTGASLLMLPYLSRKRAEDSDYPLKNNNKILTVACAATVPYILIIYFWGDYLLDALYGNAYYSSHGQLLNIFLAYLFVLTTVQVYSITLRTMENTGAIFVSKVYSALFSLSLGLILVWRWELFGAIVGLLLAAVIENTVLAYYLHRKSLDPNLS